jgi:mRNA (guanine-N7-)-methyltransferase
MPFDPVRDAVLNSPIATSQPPFYSSPRNDSPTSAFAPLVSPSLGRRATDLSVLLNADPQDPPTHSSSSLSHLLLPAHIHHDKLAHVGSLSRISEPRPPQDNPQRHSKQTQLSQSFDAGPSSSRPITASPITRSPIVSNSSPSSSSSSSSRPKSMSSAGQRPAVSPVVHPAPTPPPPSIPYNPRHRTTAPDSVLQPITSGEIELYRETYGFGTKRLKKRKRGRSSEPDASDQPHTKKLAGDVGVVVEHCEHPIISFLSSI